MSGMNVNKYVIWSILVLILILSVYYVTYLRYYRYKASIHQNRVFLCIEFKWQKQNMSVQSNSPNILKTSMSPIIQTHIIKKPSRTSISNRQVAIMNVPSLHPFRPFISLVSENQQLSAFGAEPIGTVWFCSRADFEPHAVLSLVFHAFHLLGCWFLGYRFMEKHLDWVKYSRDDTFFEYKVFDSSGKLTSI